MRTALLAIAVGLVLADSSVVTLGLPDILADFDSTPEGVSWVLTGYNLVLALAAVPAAAWLLHETHRPAGVILGGALVLFAAASLACALAGSLGMLVAARCVQGLAGAAVACAALPLLVDVTGDRRRAVAIWGLSGAIGAAVGPAAGGALTETLSWEAIFVVQVPLALVCIAGARGNVLVRDAEAKARMLALRETAPTTTRPDWPALGGLAFLGAGLTAALFLPVLLLIAGWRTSPLTAAAAVSVMPAAALVAGYLGRSIEERARGAAGAILCAGGLAALGLLPGASIGWLVAPQILIGLGLGLALGAVTEEALRDRLPLARHGAWTIAARHAGVVAALAILTPLFTSDLEERTERAQEIVLARILDSPIPPETKLDLGLRLAEQLRTGGAEVPELAPAFDRAAPADGGERPAFEALEAEIGEQLDRAATSAFERSFLVAALLAALAVLPLLLGPRMARR